MHDNETAVLSLLSQGHGPRTLLGSNGAVKERIRRVRDASPTNLNESCGGSGGGWGNAPEAVSESCGGSGGGWGNSPEF